LGKRDKVYSEFEKKGRERLQKGRNAYASRVSNGKNGRGERCEKHRLGRNPGTERELTDLLGKLDKKGQVWVNFGKWAKKHNACRAIRRPIQYEK